MALPIQKINSRLEGEFVFRGRRYSVPFTLPGDLVQFKLTRRGGRLGIEVLHIEKNPAQEVPTAEPFCRAYGICGGCRGQHLPYEAQLALKTDPIVHGMEGLGVTPEILPAGQDRGHRNRMDFVIQGEQIGFRETRGFDRFVSVEDCPAQTRPANDLLRAVRDALSRVPVGFDRSTNTGVLKYATIRCGQNSIVSLTVEASRADDERYLAFVEELKRVAGECSIVECRTTAPSDLSNGPVSRVLQGTDSYTDSLGGLEFRVAADSFFQPNPREFDRFLSRIRETIESRALFPASRGGDSARLVDLYCGAGVLSAVWSHFFPGRFSSIFGADYTLSAIANAPENLRAFRGEIDFQAVDLSRQNVRLLPEDFVLLDPPRAGLSQGVVASILEGRPANLLYVSCNPESQLRDLKLLQEVYEPAFAVIADCYPQTQHLEQAVYLKLRGAA